jgi:hypothetical protein
LLFWLRLWSSLFLPLCWVLCSSKFARVSSIKPFCQNKILQIFWTNKTQFHETAPNLAQVTHTLKLGIKTGFTWSNWGPKRGWL